MISRSDLILRCKYINSMIISSQSYDASEYGKEILPTKRIRMHFSEFFINKQKSLWKKNFDDTEIWIYRLKIKDDMMIM